MKTKNRFARILRISFICYFFILFFTMASFTDKEEVYIISGNATGVQVVPAVAGNGSGAINGTYDPSTHLFLYTCTWNNLTGAPSIANFYTGVAGTTGKEIGESWALGTNNKPTGTVTGRIILSDEQASELLAGNWYYSFGTATNYKGEIRGQITATKP